MANVASPPGVGREEFSNSPAKPFRCTTCNRVFAKSEHLSVSASIRPRFIELIMEKSDIQEAVRTLSFFPHKHAN